MGDELRAAAERLAALGHEYSDEAKNHPCETMEGAKYAGRLAGLAFAAADFAEKVLAAFPADDGEAVTKEWLLSIGACEGDNPHARQLFIDCVNFEDVGKGTVSVCDWTETAVLGRHYKTRGDVRRLLKALGIG